MIRFFYLTMGLLLNLSMYAKEPSILYLERDESVSCLVACGDTLAIGASYRERFDPTKNVSALENKATVVLVRGNLPQVRTPSKPGVIRSIVATPSGFIVAQIVYDQSGKSMSEFFSVDLSGEVTPMPSLGIDVIGLWTNSKREIFAYGSRDVFCWFGGNSVWEKVHLNPAVNSEAIRKIVSLKNGSSLVVTDRLLKGFQSLQAPPVFVKDLNTYPKQIKAYGEDLWWIVTSDEHGQRLSRVTSDGDVREITSVSRVHVQDVLFSTDKVLVLCSGEGDDVHKSSYYFLNGDGSGSLRGPFVLPDDTMSACVWSDAIVTGGALNRVIKTEIEP